MGTKRRNGTRRSRGKLTHVNLCYYESDSVIGLREVPWAWLLMDERVLIDTLLQECDRKSITCPWRERLLDVVQ